MVVVFPTNKVTWVLIFLKNEPAYIWSRNMLVILLWLYSKNVPNPSHLGYAWMRGPFIPTKGPNIKLATLTFIPNSSAKDYYIPFFSQSKLSLNIKKKIHDILYIYICKVGCFDA